MDWNDVVIGEGDKGCSATTLLKLTDQMHISSNNVSFWVSHCNFDIGMTIFKNTFEGRTLGRMILENDSPEQIAGYLNELAFDRIGYELFTKKVNASIDEAYQHGKASKQLEILNVLGVV